MENKEIKYIATFEWKPSPDKEDNKVTVEHVSLEAIHQRIAFFWEYYRLHYYDVTITVKRGEKIIVKLETNLINPK